MPHEPPSDYPSFSPQEIVSIMSGLMLAMFLASLDQTIVATSLSSIGRDLNGWRSLAWVVSAYLVTSTTTTPIYGRLSDLYGRRPILLISIGLFVGSSVLCALSGTMAQLIAARALQGVGGGGLRSVSQAVIADMIPPRERGRYQGYLSSVFATSNVLGPVLGGFFADYLSWHWIFWINLPLGLAAFILSNRNLAKLRRPQHHPKIDWLGALLILASATPILIGVANAERAGGWLSVDSFGPIAGGLMAIAALILWERIAREPMLPLRLFRNSIFSVASIISFLVMMVMIGLIVLVPMDYQLGAGLSANAAGIRMIPMTIGTVIGSFISGQLITYTGRYRIFPIIGTSTGMIACAVIAWAGLGHSLAFDILATGILGMSFGGQLAPMTVTVQNALHSHDNGIGVSCLMFFRLMGGAFGVALLSTILIARLAAGALAIPGHEALGPNPGIALFHLDEPGLHLTPALLAALGGAVERAFAHVFIVAAVILAFAVIGALRLKEVPLRGR
ncbi:MAG TPA: MDR family MFS transporter [Alphaproteobacteria bacterium]|nr:MDR family MFS transporter [Alphaproteobacteria bacterium]